MDIFNYGQSLVDFKILNKLLDHFHSRESFLLESDPVKCHEMVIIWASTSLSLTSEEKLRCKTLISSDIVSLLKHSHVYELMHTYECFLDLIDVGSLVKDDSLIITQDDKTTIFSFHDLAREFIKSCNYNPLKEMMFKMDREFNSMTNQELKWLWLSIALIND